MISKSSKIQIFKAFEAKEAGRRLREGALVIFPTETVYGVGASVMYSKAMDTLSLIKNRPPEKPFSYHFSSLDHFFTFAGEGLDVKSKSIFQQWMPASLTLIYFDHIWQKKIGVRIPEHPVAVEMIEAAGVPVAAPSANFSGKEAPTSLESVDPEFMALCDCVLEPGDHALDNHSLTGVSSTIIDITSDPYIILRQGSFKP